MWIDEVCKLTGGIDICAIEAVQAKEGQQIIVDVRLIATFDVGLCFASLDYLLLID